MRYTKFLTVLFAEPFPSPEDYLTEDEDGFRLAAVAALAKAILKIHKGDGVSDNGSLGEARRTIHAAIHNDESILRARIAALEAEIASLKVGMEDRKLIEQAKGVIMQTGVGEREAYRRLQTMASKNNMKLAVLARKVLELTDLFEQP